MKSRWALLALIWSLSAGAISRVGNRVVDDEQNEFSIEVPSEFPLYEMASKDKLRLRGSLFYTPSGVTELQFVEISRMSAEFPELQMLDREQLKSAMLARKWWVRDSGQPCVAEFLGETETAAYAMAAWGLGHGFVAVGPNSNQTKQALMQMLNSLKLHEGACSWK